MSHYHQLAPRAVGWMFLRCAVLYELRTVTDPLRHAHLLRALQLFHLAIYEGWEPLQVKRVR